MYYFFPGVINTRSGLISLFIPPWRGEGYIVVCKKLYTLGLWANYSIVDANIIYET